MALVGALGLAGCGSDDDYANTPRPPSPINVTAAITAKEIALSPEDFGAGPITLIVTNQTTESVELTLETESSASGEAGIRQATGPINPSGTSQLTVDLKQGRYTLSADKGSIREAELDVSKPRKSAQDELLQP